MNPKGYAVSAGVLHLATRTTIERRIQSEPARYQFRRRSHWHPALRPSRSRSIFNPHWRTA